MEEHRPGPDNLSSALPGSAGATRHYHATQPRAHSSNRTCKHARNCSDRLPQHLSLLKSVSPVPRTRIEWFDYLLNIVLHTVYNKLTNLQLTHRLHDK